MKPKHRLLFVIGSLLLAAVLTGAWLSGAQAARPPQPPVEQPPAGRPAVPPGRANHSLTAVGGGLYMFGGNVDITGTTSSSAELWRFDPEDNTWVVLPTPANGPPARSFHAAAAISDTLYILGGQDNSGKKLDDVWVYNPATGQWSEAKQDTRPPARSKHAAVPNGNTFLVYGGEYQSTKLPADVWTYDPATGYWSLHSWMSNHQDNQSGHTAGMIGNKLYLVGGNNTTTSNLVQTYDLTNHSFGSITTTMASPKPLLRRNHAGVITNTDIYLFGGESITNTSGLKDSWRFNLDSHTWVQLPDLPGPLTGARAAVITGTLSGGRPAALPAILITGGFDDQGQVSPTSYIFDGEEYQPIQQTGYRILLPVICK